ncbi:cytidine deaminase [Fulvivirga ligni]|uniref:cytidine deaminase n=1 Tax=Fulvivirga ligni TaxID=2904246 RepID=UPI001EFFCDD0|nr:cytidine deaminase [Fulvivirga ligni]UII23100.1 cytidine deaminase [Fulvivirga ligni]
MAEELIGNTEYSTYSFSELEEEVKDLIKKAEQACDTSYSPYSNFQVGAAVLLENGEVVTGSNQENSSFPAGLCAERVALFFIGANYAGKKIKKVAVTAKRKGESEFVPVTPCGGCRQVLLETETRQESNINVIIQSSYNQWVITKSTKVLLPFCFNKHSL